MEMLKNKLDIVFFTTFWQSQKVGLRPGTSQAVMSKQERRSTYFRTKHIETKNITGTYYELGNQAYFRFWFKFVNIYERYVDLRSCFDVTA